MSSFSETRADDDDVGEHDLSKQVCVLLRFLFYRLDYSHVSFHSVGLFFSKTPFRPTVSMTFATINCCFSALIVFMSACVNCRLVVHYLEIMF